ncbi:MAG TPA: dihydrofolate reductase [Polyangiaceae bacterium]|nr:dihydrofolate reductase [Polyangiaceae bacterium]
MRGIVYAVSPEGVIGVDGKIPWRHGGDLRRFKRLTMGSTVIMGRTTFESIGKALTGRRNIVVTRGRIDVPGVETARSIDEALALAGGSDVWFIGGARIYAEGMKYADVIDVTYVPDRVASPNAVLAPRIDEVEFEAGPLVAHEDEPELTRRVYARRKA